MTLCGGNGKMRAYKALETQKPRKPRAPNWLTRWPRLKRRVQTLISFIDLGNVASRAVAERMGAKYEKTVIPFGSEAGIFRHPPPDSNAGLLAQTTNSLQRIRASAAEGMQHLLLTALCKN